ncbi:LTA synthase family protein [uncultured Gemmiger sp.]|uniref:LTA synthase family protein n=1 Tax=uncultured Gemmiger sp. TaxID=1623490 RepID=UPI0025E36753|nr:sulfatase-like hydrolase/transferase [uncultured Gemmiger sp.]
MQHFKNFDWKKFLMQGVLPCLLAVAVGFISRYQLELSDGVTESFLALQWPLYAPLNALTAFCLTLILFAMLGRWWLSTALSGAVFTIIALINYYTRDLHGSALMPQDILNLGTAAEVMGSYTLKITHDVIKIALLFLPILAIAFVQRRLCKGAPKRASWPARGVRVAGSALCVFLVMFFGYFGPVTVKPKTTYGWAWQNTYYTYGYLAGTIEATSLMADPIIEPEGYSDAAAVEAFAKADGYTGPATAETAQDYPDVVLILSESFYDFDLVTDLQADTDIMPVTKNLPNSVYGHTISPHVGGGTNSTEYEMLTSNSLILMPSITPFNWLNLYNANSVVSYLKGLGYSTMAAHPYTNSNYRRDSAWLALGFDETHFEDDFPTQDRYGDRPYQSDSATYKDWEKLYEAMPEDKPRFSFLVSIQSHGDYDMNDASLDIVHAATDYGEYDELMDEYLSCIKMTDAAVQELCDYFTAQYEKTGRKVIVAMAGDHAPSFVTHVADPSFAAAGNDLELLERSTPFFIWANYPLEHTDAAVSTADPLNRMDMVMLTPTLLQQAGLPLSDYYKYLLEMKQNTPVVTAANDYMKADGTTAVYGVDPALDAWVKGYLNLEYNNIGAHAKREQSIFTPTD